MSRMSILVFGILVYLLLGMTPVSASSDSPDAPLVVIGSGTAASCQSQSAANAFSDAVAAGGTITFDCGSQMVTIKVNTSVTDKTVTIDGGNRITLSGDKLRQFFIVTGSGNLTLQNLALVDGKGFSGAAIRIDGASARLSIYNSSLTGHDSESNHGGAIFNGGATVEIDRSTLALNKSGGLGGAIFTNGGSLSISNSTLINNSARQGGGIYHSEGTVEITNSIIRFNRAEGSNPASGNQGGGLYIDVGTATVVNSTFYDNRAAGGGAIYTQASSLTLTNLTFNRNRADTGAALWQVAGQTTARNTIFANSRNSNDSADSLNCDGATIISGGRNIISDNSCVLNPSSVGDLHSTDAMLESINFPGDNGGPTRTFMLREGSPAIDYALNCPATDQRGYPRPMGAGCDVGAVERGWLLFLPSLQR
jgi:predicted outer membrane repeat protein